MRFFRLPCLLVLAPGATNLCAQPHVRPVPLSADTVAFVNVNVIPMDREHLLWRRTVIIAGGRIAAIGSVDSIAVPPGAKVIDGEHRYFLTPGLADMHVHLRYPSDLLLLLANGVTRVRNMRGTPTHLDWRARVASGALSGPRIITAGPVLWGDRNARTPAEARAEVDSESTAGYDFIKVYDGLKADAYAAIVDEAARRHLPVAGHVPTALGIEGVLRAHQASIEHVEQYVYHYFGDDLDDVRIPAIARATAAARVFVTPTISYTSSFVLMVEDRDSILRRPEMRYVHPETYAWWRTDVKTNSGLNRVLDPFQDKLVRAFREAGVQMMAGTDFYIFGSVPGFGLHRELQALQHAGLTPYEVLSTATRIPANYAGDSVTVGTLAVGRDADILVLDANPLDDISNTTRQVGVMVRGRWMPHAEIQAQLDSLALSFEREQRLVDFIMKSGGKAAHDLAVAERRADSSAFGESTLGLVGGWLMRQSRYPDAIAVQQWISDAYPRSANARLGLGDAYLAAGDRTMAAQAYREALQREPGRQDIADKLKKVQP
jgi:imidazolonepropionase-like amidohydrolase